MDDLKDGLDDLKDGLANGYELWQVLCAVVSPLPWSVRATCKEAKALFDGSNTELTFGDSGFPYVSERQREMLLKMIRETPELKALTVSCSNTSISELIDACQDPSKLTRFVHTGRAQGRWNEDVVSLGRLSPKGLRHLSISGGSMSPRQ